MKNHKTYKTTKIKVNDIHQLCDVFIDDCDYVFIENSEYTFNDIPDDIHDVMRKYNIILPYKRDIENLATYLCTYFTADEIDEIFNFLRDTDLKLPHTYEQFKRIQYITPIFDVLIMCKDDFIDYQKFIKQIMNNIKVNEDNINNLLIVFSSLYFVNTFKKILRLEITNE